MLRVCVPRRTIFDACYVLNLDRRVDRWRHAEKELQRAKLERFLQPNTSITRVSGVDGATLDVASLHRDGVITDLGYERYQLPADQKLFGMDLTPGAIGCALGHRAVWQRVVVERRQCALILEDDFEFHHRFARQFRERWSRVPSDWGVVHLGGLDLLASDKPPRPYVADGIRLAYQGHRELTAYVVNAASAQRCLDLSLPMTWQVDTHISSVLAEDPAAKDRYISDPKMYVFQPSLVIQLTSLGTDVQKKESDNPALEDAARRMREFVAGETSPTASSSGSSRLPKLRSGPRSNPLSREPSSPCDGARNSAQVSNSALTSAQRALHSENSAPARSGVSRDGPHSPLPPSTNSGVYSAYNSDPGADSRSFSSLYAPGASDNSVHNSRNASPVIVDRLRFPAGVSSRAPLSHGPSLRSPSLVAAAAALAAKLEAPSPTRPSHLEYTSQPTTLPRESYLPELQSDTPGAAVSLPARGVLALQDATTGLLVRHLAADESDPLEGDNSVVYAAAATTNTNASLKPAYSASGEQRADTLPRAAPFISAAVRDAGVDDRITPLRLDKMIRQGRRQAAAAAAAAAAEAQERLEHAKRYPSSLPTSTTAAATADGTKAKAADSGGGGGSAAAGAVPGEARYHEPPALQAAYSAVPAALTETAKVSASPPAYGEGFAEILTEYATDAPAEEERLAQQRTPQDKATLSKRSALLLMSAPDYTRLASAASANDAAFIRQLVNYYTARPRATTAASRKVRLTAASLSGTGGAARTQPVQTPPPLSDEASVLHAASVAPTTSTAADAGGDFSLLDAVLAVSREYVEVQAAEIGQPGKGTAALSERRRHLLHQLVTLDQTRIPESLWVTAAPPLSRLTALTTTSTATTAAASTHHHTVNSTTGVGGDARHASILTTRRSEAGGTGLAGAGALVTTASCSAMGTSDLHASTSDQVRASVDVASNVATQRGESVHRSHRPRATTSSATSNSIFPAARPMDRSQVYMLADVLDRMLHDPAHPRWVEVLSNPEVARYVFAEKEEEEGDKQEAEGKAVARVSPQEDAYVELWGKPGEQRLLAYTDAALQVLDILDTGLSELVRQVTCHCTERGALLDLLRQSVVDIAAAQVHLLSQVKRQARQDAATALALRNESNGLRRKYASMERELADLKKAHEQLQSRIEPIQRKSDRLDELMARVASKARRFETHRHDEHIALLQLLEESMKLTASAAADSFYNEVNDMHARHAGTGDAEGPNYNGNSSALVALANEMPSVTAARTHAAEQRRTMEQMYGESHQLLRALQDTVEATNAVCAPLYKKMVLTGVSPVAKVATSRWTAIARAVGGFEKEKRHRQRVYDVFTEYCTVHRHHLAAQAAKEGSGRGGQHDAPLGEWAAAGEDGGAVVQSYGESFLAASPSSSSAVDRKRHSPETDAAAETAGKPLAETATEPDAALTTVAIAKSAKHAPLPPGAIITHTDLEAMSATDCSVEEVNALFHKDFDVRSYLRGSWEDYIRDHRQQEAASGLGDAYTLRLPDLLQMLSDMHATLSEVTMRMRAMADSGVLQALLKPPLEPPAHPEVPCPLCSRRDTCETDRQRRREAMSRIARDLQGKMDAVEAKSRAAQLERDEAKREVRRLQMELQQVSKGNMPASASSSLAKSTASAHHVRIASTSSFRRERRDTSVPQNQGLHRESSFSHTNTQKEKPASPPGTHPSSRTPSSGDAPSRRGGRNEEDNSDTMEISLVESQMQRTTAFEPSTSPTGTPTASFFPDGEDDDGEGENDTSIPAQRRATAAM